MAFRNIYLGMMAFSFLFAISPFFPFFGVNVAAYALDCGPIFSPTSTCSNISGFGGLFELTYYGVVTMPLGIFFFLLFAFFLKLKTNRLQY